LRVLLPEPAGGWAGISEVIAGTVEVEADIGLAV
jgi:hypothetical protein